MLATPHRGRAAARPARRRSLFATLRAALALHRGRARLAELDDHILRDIGLTRAEAMREAARPIWDVPAHWRAPWCG